MYTEVVFADSQKGEPLRDVPDGWYVPADQPRSLVWLKKGGVITQFLSGSVITYPVSVHTARRVVPANVKLYVDQK